MENSFFQIRSGNSTTLRSWLTAGSRLRGTVGQIRDKPGSCTILSSGQGSRARFKIKPTLSLPGRCKMWLVRLTMKIKLGLWARRIPLWSTIVILPLAMTLIVLHQEDSPIDRIIRARKCLHCHSASWRVQHRFKFNPNWKISYLKLSRRTRLPSTNFGRMPCLIIRRLPP